GASHDGQPAARRGACRGLPPGVRRRSARRRRRRWGGRQEEWKKRKLESRKAGRLASCDFREGRGLLIEILVGLAVLVASGGFTAEKVMRGIASLETARAEARAMQILASAQRLQITREANEMGFLAKLLGRNDDAQAAMQTAIRDLGAG